MRTSAFALLTLGLFSGCHLFGTGGGGGEVYTFTESTLMADSTEARFAELYTHWRERQAEAYAFTYEAQCFCMERGPFVVTVGNGAVTSIDPAGAPDYRRLTLDSLYATVAEAFDRNAASVRYRYDPDSRLLASFFIDYDYQMADEEFGAVIQQVNLSR